MRNRIFAVLVIAILAGGGLAYATYNFVNNKPARQASVPTQPVVVAAADLQLGAELKKEDLEVIQFPQGKAPEGAFANPSDLVGRGVIAPIVKNELILGGKLASKEAGAGLPPVIPEGMRAVSVRVNEVVGVAGYVLPGNRVDVIATASPTNQPNDTTSKVVLSNVQVLTSGSRIEPDKDKGKPVPVTVVTLLVNPDQAERLALASTEGKIQLALRNPMDQGSPVTTGIKQAGLLGTTSNAGPRMSVAGRPASRPKGAPVAEMQPVAGRPASRPKGAPVAEMQPPPPPPAPTVEMIRGDKRATEIIK